MIFPSEHERRIAIGLMSGTSMDGIDAALIDLERQVLIHGMTYPYSVDTKNRLIAMMLGEQRDMTDVCQLNQLIGYEFAKASLSLLQECNYTYKDVLVIGSHGQTVFHEPDASIPYTLQLGCAHTIAELTGITVVADFRTRDLVVKGQGAPLAPLYHQALFGQSDTPLAIVNIGGISNVTFLGQGVCLSGYDTGPGNCLLDMWAQKHLNTLYDEDGSWAMSGEVIPPLLNSLMNDPFIQQKNPKSIDKSYFSYTWLLTHLESTTFRSQDIQATLVAFTANTIAQAVKNQKGSFRTLLICGGGVHNMALRRALAHYLPNLEIKSTESVGVHPEFLEAMMFAWLAEKTLNRIPLDLSLVTGSCKPVILGAVYYS